MQYATKTTFIGHSSQPTKIHGFQELGASHPALKWVCKNIQSNKRILFIPIHKVFREPNLRTMHFAKVAYILQRSIILNPLENI